MAGAFASVRIRLRPALDAWWDLRFWSQAQDISRMFEEDKRQYLAAIARQRHLTTFVETGTFLGKTSALLAEVCQSVITVEIEPTLHANAVELFRDRPQVSVLLGDSGQLMPTILAGITEPTLFWLDGHYSGGITGGGAESPILRELRAVLHHSVQDHVIVIDDARLFRGRDGYPQLREIVRLVQRESPYRIALFADLIRIQREDL